MTFIYCAYLICVFHYFGASYNVLPKTYLTHFFSPYFFFACFCRAFAYYVPVSTALLLPQQFPYSTNSLPTAVFLTIIRNRPVQYIKSRICVSVLLLLQQYNVTNLVFSPSFIFQYTSFQLLFCDIIQRNIPKSV